MKRLLKHLALALGYGALAVLLTGLAGYVYFLRGQPDLHPWHTAELKGEFRAADATSVPDFAAYLGKEEALFREVSAEVYDRAKGPEAHRANRFHTGSESDPQLGGTNWNRSFEFAPAQPRGAVLLLHGLTDSPYSLRALGQTLAGRGFYVLGLRLPGHGTAPVGLTTVTMEDFQAATRIAARHARSRSGTNTPFYLVGYSHGASLAVEYALARMEGENLPPADGLVLISPAIAISPAAALAPLQGGLARLPGLEKAAWTAVLPEFDPYKYNSFAVNAAVQMHRLTVRIYDRLGRLDRGAGVTNFPPVLALQSVVDSTVLPRAVIDRFLRMLAPGGHELVLFDILRTTEARALMVARPEQFTEELVADRSTPFAVTALTTASPQSRNLRTVYRAAGTTNIVATPVALEWPRGLFSLSHVALPFAPADPVYGDGSGALPGRIQLGNLALRGENGVLLVSPAAQLRLRHNPFYSYLESRVLGFIGSTNANSASAVK